MSMNSHTSRLRNFAAGLSRNQFASLVCTARLCRPKPVQAVHTGVVWSGGRRGVCQACLDSPRPHTTCAHRWRNLHSRTNSSMPALPQAICHNPVLFAVARPPNSSTLRSAWATCVSLYGPHPTLHPNTSRGAASTAAAENYKENRLLQLHEGADWRDRACNHASSLHAKPTPLWHAGTLDSRSST